MDSETSRQCVNCGISLMRLRKRWMAEESEEIRQLLSDWTCTEPEATDALCSECFKLLHLALNSEDKSRKFGHENICLVCGLTLVKLRTSPPLNEHLEHKLVLAQWTRSHQVKRSEVVCKNCWGKADTVVNNKNKGDSKPDTKDVKNEPLHPLLLLGDGEVNIPASPEPQSDEDENLPETNAAPHSIILPSYKRAADSSSSCIFKHCKETELSTPPKVILERLLIDYCYYIPTTSRICKQHHVNSHKVWRELVNEADLSNFTAVHVENLFSILKNTKCNSYFRNFESEIKQNDYLCQFWLGVEHEKYEEMLKDMRNFNKSASYTRKALAMYLMKKHTGFSVDKLAKFFGARNRLLKDIVNRVHGHFENLVASDDSYVAITTVGCDNKEDIVYHKI